MTNRAAAEDGVPWRVELGRRLRYERDARGWSRCQLAGRLRAASGDDKPPEVRQLTDMVKQWERGVHAPGPGYRRRYCHVFGIAEAVLFAEAEHPASPWLVGVKEDVDRERLVAVHARPALLDARTVEALGVVLARQRRLEDAVGSAPMIEPARAHLSLVSRLLREARPGDAVGRALAAVGSDGSQFVGWLSVATGGHDAAGPLYDQSLRLGLQAGDHELAATALSMRGHLAWVTDDLGEMAALSRAARGQAGSPATRATAAQ